MNINMDAKFVSSEILKSWHEQVCLYLPFSEHEINLFPDNMAHVTSQAVTELECENLYKRNVAGSLLGNLENIMDMDHEWVKIDLRITPDDDESEKFDAIEQSIHNWARKSCVSQNRGERMAFVSEMRKPNGVDFMWQVSVLFHRVVHYSQRRACVYPVKIDDLEADINNLLQTIRKFTDCSVNLVMNQENTCCRLNEPPSENTVLAGLYEMHHKKQKELHSIETAISHLTDSITHARIAKEKNDAFLMILDEIMSTEVKS